MAFNLKSEEEVKEYLKNLYTEYKFGCLSEKRPEGESERHNLEYFSDNHVSRFARTRKKYN